MRNSNGAHSCVGTISLHILRDGWHEEKLGIFMLYQNVQNVSIINIKGLQYFKLH